MVLMVILFNITIKNTSEISCSCTNKTDLVDILLPIYSMWHFNIAIKVRLLPSTKIFLFALMIDSSTKVMKNAFYFILQALFVRKTFKFLS